MSIRNYNTAFGILLFRLLRNKELLESTNPVDIKKGLSEIDQHARNQSQIHRRID